MEHKARHCLGNSFIPWSCVPLCPARCHTLGLSPCLIPNSTDFLVTPAFEAKFHVNLHSRITDELSSTAGQAIVHPCQTLSPACLPELPSLSVSLVASPLCLPYLFPQWLPLSSTQVLLGSIFICAAGPPHLLASMKVLSLPPPSFLSPSPCLSMPSRGTEPRALYRPRNLSHWDTAPAG